MAPPRGCCACLRAAHGQAACVLGAARPHCRFGPSTFIFPLRATWDRSARSTVRRLSADRAGLDGVANRRATVVRRLTLDFRPMECR